MKKDHYTKRDLMLAFVAGFLVSALMTMIELVVFVALCI